MKSITIIRWLFWNLRHCIRKCHFLHPRTKPHTFQRVSNTVFDDYTVMHRLHRPQRDRFIVQEINVSLLDPPRTGFRIQSTKCMSVVDLWKKFQHSNVVQLREVFTTKNFGDQCECTMCRLNSIHYWNLSQNCSSGISVRLSSRISNIISEILYTCHRYEWRLSRSIPRRG